ncbi:FAD-dependent oxidoreductase [Sinorhizobium psoraleae]|uniref:FAD-dependent oxidoreductase n=1 Tax=Sinorhizobium psoraleae TaxID=520838 RepID=A0ABT4K9Z0_9HYPH|nr:FAD-dependent oxidoreductase [Sinorhizobium psoraleae]MCZ4088689.1 FAD-dependent oxidoreductase [Sinorhizobium psoraleae]
MRIREESLARIASGAGFDVLVIGGGVNGVAVLRELALNGVSALLVDRADFCKGATSASSRMAHGGLRYLENREFKLVAESARERNLLLKYAPISPGRWKWWCRFRIICADWPDRSCASSVSAAGAAR